MCPLSYHCCKYVLCRHRISLVTKTDFGEENWMVGGRGGRELSFYYVSFVLFKSMSMYYLLKRNSFLGKRW